MKVKTICAVILLILLMAAGCGPAEQAEGDPIKIAVAGPMTHDSGQHIWWNVSMAVEEINEAGGVLVGDVMRPIELVRVDTNELQSVPDAVTAIERAITVDKVDFIVGGWNSEPVMAMQDVAADYQKIFISEGTATAMSNRVRDDYDRYKYWFRAYGSTIENIPLYFGSLPLFIDLVRDELGIDTPKVAVMMDKAEAYEPLIPVADAYILQAGGENVGVWRPSLTATDLSTELLAIKNAGAHIIFHFMYGPSSLVAAKQWEELKIPAAMIGINGEAPYGTFMESTGGLGDYLSTTGFVPVEMTEKTIPYYEKFVTKYGEQPQIVWTHFYDAIYQLKESIERAGTLDSDAIVTELEQLEYVGALGRYVRYGPETDDAHSVKMGPGHVVYMHIQYQDGKQVAIWPSVDGSWEGVSFPGTVEAKLPPWMLDYWKSR